MKVTTLMSKADIKLAEHRLLNFSNRVTQEGDQWLGL